MGPDRIAVGRFLPQPTIPTPRRDPRRFTGQFDGVAIVTETPQVRDAVTRLKLAGLNCCCALVSDLPGSSRDHFVGVDNVAANRTGWHMMGRFLGGKDGQDTCGVQFTLGPSRDGLGGGLD